MGAREEQVGQDAVVSSIRRQDAEDQHSSQSEEGRIQLRFGWRTHPIHETEDESERVGARAESDPGGVDARETEEDCQRLHQTNAEGDEACKGS